MKVSYFDVEIDSRSIQSGVSNISSTGKPECTKRTYNCTLRVHTNTKKNIIYVTTNNSITVDSGELGSYSGDNIYGGFFLPKNNDEYKEIISSLKKGNIPNSCIFDIFMSNFDPQEYNCDNNWPMRLRGCGDYEVIIHSLSNNKIPVYIDYYDCFEHEDGLQTYPSEDLYGYVAFSIDEFKKLFTKERVKFLWDYLEIDKNYNVEDRFGKIILDDSNLREVIKDGFNRLKPTKTNSNIPTILKNIDDTVKAHNEMMAQRAIDTEKSNAKFREKNKNEVFLTEKQKNTITLSGMVDLDRNSKIDFESKINLLNDIHFETYGEYMSFDYFEFIDYIIEKFLNPSDGVDTNYAFESFSKLYKISEKSHTSKLNLKKLNVEDGFRLLALDFELKEDKFLSLLDLPLRTPIQILQTTLK